MSHMSIPECLEWATYKSIGVEIVNFDDAISVHLEDLSKTLKPSIHSVTIGYHEKEMLSEVLANVLSEMFLEREEIKSRR